MTTTSVATHALISDAIAFNLERATLSVLARLISNPVLCRAGTGRAIGTQSAKYIGPVVSAVGGELTDDLGGILHRSWTGSPLYPDIEVHADGSVTWTHEDGHVGTDTPPAEIANALRELQVWSEGVCFGLETGRRAALSSTPTTTNSRSR